MREDLFHIALIDGKLVIVTTKKFSDLPAKRQTNILRAVAKTLDKKIISVENDDYNASKIERFAKIFKKG